MAESELNSVDIDVKEDEILQLDKELLEILLVDRTRTKLLQKKKGKENSFANILWCTDGYESLGTTYSANREIKIEQITGKHSSVITPRVKKSKEQQLARVRDKAEVFTPSWVCNAQNNLVDEAWFGRKNVFNKEINNEDGTHSWKTNLKKIEFPEGKTWKDYVRDTRMEITCGEAPYIASRYDATTGEPIAVNNRIGLLDRKLRVVGENTETSGDWLEYALVAYKNIYGYDWQGDNVLLARESLLFTFVDFYKAKFGEQPSSEAMKAIAEIISWNIWQMDGLKFVVPETCKPVVHKPQSKQLSFFDEVTETKKEPAVTPCPGCASGDPSKHNGIKCKIMDWTSPNAGENKGSIEFYKLIKKF